MRRSWTDERLDDLNARVDRIDAKVDRIDEKVDRIEADMRAGFEGLYRLMIQISAIVIAALIGLIATISSVAITQL